MAAAAVPRAGLLPRSQDERREEDGSEESEEEVESDDGSGSEAASLADLCDADAGSDEDPTFDPGADGDLEVDAVLQARMSGMSISASALKGRKGSAAVPKMGKQETDLLAMVGKLMQGDACKGDVVMFEQNIYRRKKGAPRDVKGKGRLCGQRTNADRIIKESYGTDKQQHTFTIEIFWSKGYKPWPPLHPLLIKGRNLYKDKTMRQPWPDEEERNRVLQEKHARGFLARKTRAVRIHEKEKEKMMRLNRIKENKSKEQRNTNRKSSQEVLTQPKVEPMNTVHQRTDERKGPSLQNVEPDNTRQLHISRKTAPTQHNEVLTQKGAPRALKQEITDHQVPSVQHGGSQQQIFSKPTHTQQVVKDLHEHPNYQHRGEVLPQDGAMRTSIKEFIDRQAPSQHNGGSGNTRQHHTSSKPAPREMLKYPQQPLGYQDHNGVRPCDDVKRTYTEQSSDHLTNNYHATEYNEPAYQPQRKFTQHTSAYQPRGKFTQHGNAYQRGSSCHLNAQADHQVHPPLRSRNQDFNSRDQFYGQDYYCQGYRYDRRKTYDNYDSRPNWNQNHCDRKQMAQDSYHIQQNQHHYNDHRRMNQKQYPPQQKQPQRFPVQAQLQPCNFFYRNGWCAFGETCRYSHDF